MKLLDEIASYSCFYGPSKAHPSWRVSQASRSALRHARRPESGIKATSCTQQALQIQTPECNCLVWVELRAACAFCIVMWSTQVLLVPLWHLICYMACKHRRRSPHSSDSRSQLLNARGLLWKILTVHKCYGVCQFHCLADQIPAPRLLHLTFVTNRQSDSQADDLCPRIYLFSKYCSRLLTVQPSSLT
jgi:hypothetical protein